MYRNEGNGKFTDVSKATRTDDTRWALALQSADLDGDLRPDIYVANDFGDHTYFCTIAATARSRTLAKKAGVLDPAFGMGVTVDDYDGDGRLDFFVSNYSFPLNWFLRDPRYPMPPFPYSLGRPLVWRRLTKLSRGSSLFRNLGGDRFTDTSEEADVWDTSWSWGCVFVDADLDGRADLFVVNGMVTGKNEPEREIDFWNLMSVEFRNFEKGIPIAEFGDDSLWGRLPKRFYRNRDGRHFDELAAATGLESIGNQRGLVVLDADGDGDPGPLRVRLPSAERPLDQPEPVARENARRLARRRPDGAGPPSLHPRGARGDGDRRSRRPLAHPGRLRRLLVPLVGSARALLRPRRRGDSRPRHDPLALRPRHGAP